MRNSATPADGRIATRTDVLIVGAGFSGLGMAVQLRRSGRDDFLLLEKAAEVGGTWRDNTYPGCACDIPSQMYSYSYELNPRWTRAYSPQPEILGYLRKVADDYDLRRCIRFGVEVQSARWNEDTSRWTVTAQGGATFECRVLVSAIGALHIPKVPADLHRECFRGPQFHSAQWRHDVDLTGRRVAVVGTGASSVQFIPEIAGEVAELRVFQRSAPWILPRPDREVSERARLAFQRVPGLHRAYRDYLYWVLESRAVGFNGHPRLLQAAERLVRRRVERHVTDPATRALLTPDYRLGCKRVLMSNDYLRTFERANVHLHGGGMQRVTPSGVVGADGVEHEVDVIIWGTGFSVTDSFQQVDITGVGGRDLAEEFERDGVEAYLGMNIAGFPNMAFLLGPNTGLGHNSVVFMIEQQARYVRRLLDEADRRGGVFDVTRTAQHRFNQRLQRKLDRGIWSTGGCTSWYLDSHGRNRSIWPGFTWRYWAATRQVHSAAYSWGRRRPAPQRSEIAAPVST